MSPRIYVVYHVVVISLLVYFFIVLLNHAKFRSPKWRLNNNFSRQGGKVSRIGDRIGRNFEP